jgi:hypothetical protein
MIDINEEYIRFIFEKAYKSQNFEINPEDYSIEKKKRNILTIVLDMRDKHNTLHLKINNIIFPCAFCSIPHKKRMIRFGSDDGQIITLISITYLEILPIDTILIKQYLSGYSGNMSRRIVNENRKKNDLS